MIHPNDEDRIKQIDNYNTSVKAILQLITIILILASIFTIYALINLKG